MQKYEALMRKCMEYAVKFRFEVAPNPMVGAIVYDEKKDEIISLGAHKKYGQAHAEVDAINQAIGCDFSDKTLIVNLEPCCHRGKTPPCCDLIIEKGFKKVVIGARDLNPLVSSCGIKKLQEAGIEVVADVLADECVQFNKVFFKNILKKSPFVMAKTAFTLDSKIATSTGESKWITGEASRGVVQKLRSEHFAILSGSGTVLADNPRLNVRLEGAKSPDRIIIDRFGKIPFDYNVFLNDGCRVFLVTKNFERDFPKNVIPVEFENFEQLFLKLYRDFNIFSIFVETGQKTLSAILEENLIDELYCFVAPKIFGAGVDFVSNLGIEKIENALELEFFDVQKVGADILIKSKIKKGDKN